MKNKRFPNYPDDTDYTTNAPSYYEDLARKNKLIEILSKRIWEYDQELAKRFDAWDKNLEDFPEDVKLLLQEWLSDGTLDHIINDTIFNWKLDTTIFEQFRDVITTQVEQTEQQLRTLSYTINPSEILNGDITQAIQNAIETVRTHERTEGIPEITVKGEIKLPSGRYKITASIKIPSNIKITGNGKNVTVLLSELDNGEPVFHVNGKNTTDNFQFFYNSFEDFTIHGQNKRCVGIRMDNTSRWSMNNVMINETKYEGLYLYESYLGELQGLLVRACGDENHASVVHDGSDLNNGTHAITYTGGEIVGAPLSLKTIKCGLLIKKGFSNSLFGTTIEAFFGGYGIIEEQAVATNVIGCYFEYNKGNILSLYTEGANYTGNFMTLTTPDALGFIVIKQFNGGVISGNTMKENTPTLKNIAKYDESSTMLYSAVKDNIVTGFPLRMDESLIHVSNSIESFDGNFSVNHNGEKTFKGTTTFDGETRAVSGLTRLGGAGVKGTASYPSMLGGSGTPENKIIAPLGSLYLQMDGDTGRSLWIKERPTRGGRTDGGWNVMQSILSGTTASRPTVTTVGFQFYDTSIGKPIWWNGTLWKDATNATV